MMVTFTSVTSTNCRSRGGGTSSNRQESINYSQFLLKIIAFQKSISVDLLGNPEPLTAGKYCFVLNQIICFLCSYFHHSVLQFKVRRQAGALTALEMSQRGWLAHTQSQTHHTHIHTSKRLGTHGRNEGVFVLLNHFIIPEVQ